MASALGELPAGSGIEHERGILNCSSHRSNVVEAPGQGEYSSAAHPAVARLQPHDATQAGGHADRSPGIRANCTESHPGGHRHRGTRAGSPWGQRS